MKIGFVNVVPWRPHHECATFMAKIMESMGHQVVLIQCSGSRSHCFQKLTNQRLLECGYCQTRAIMHSLKFPGKTARISGTPSTAKTAQGVYAPSVLSSAGSCRREELDNWHTLPTGKEAGPELLAIQDDYKNLVAGFTAALNQHRIDLLFVFNGRFHDVAAAIEAANQTNTPYVSYERSWFGKGLQLNTNSDCLSIESPASRIQQQALSNEELLECFDLVNSRIRGSLTGEWRNYGQGLVNHAPSELDAALRGKVLVVPSSRSEFLGHQDYEIYGQATSVERLTLFLHHYQIPADQVIVRAHPAWKTPIGSCARSKSDAVYREWCRKHRATYIPPDDASISTYQLMQGSKLCVFNGGSAAAEATLLGVPSVVLSPCAYMDVGFVTNLAGAPSDWPDALPVMTSAEDVVLMLRYIHYRYREQVTFFDAVRQLKTTKFSFNQDHPDNIPEMARVINLATTRQISNIYYKPNTPVTSREITQIKLLNRKHH